MIKIRSILVFAVIPLIAGYLVAGAESKKPAVHISSDFNNHAVLTTDRITFINQGNIISLTQSDTLTIPTHNSSLIEASPLKNNYIAVNKQTNYSSLIEFTQEGKQVKEIFNGNTGNIDTMNWYTDPSINKAQNRIAFVSDMDKAKTDVMDNALFITDLTTETTKKIVKPDPHSGGITHPIWNPVQKNILAYDFYQYDTQTLNPYSVIMTYDTDTQNTTTLTTEDQNAYQGSYSPDGKHFLFLQRNTDNTVSMYIADISNNTLSHEQKIATGDFAYPAFSHTPTHIYYLQAQGNSGYDLYQATIQDNNLENISAITKQADIAANSGFTINGIK